MGIWVERQVARFVAMAVASQVSMLWLECLCSA